jgi:hypothetical protein
LDKFLHFHFPGDECRRKSWERSAWYYMCSIHKKETSNPRKNLPANTLLLIPVVPWRGGKHKMFVLDLLLT